jgi:CubicO group peptidase (beta-lactamase class C family)
MTSRREFLSKGSLSLLGLAAVPSLLSQCTSSDSNTNPDVFSFPSASPESQGISSQAIIDFVKAANDSKLEWHSFKILRHGNVVAEGHWSPFKEEYKHTLYSLSKSFTSTAIGFAVKKGLISVEDQVISFFPNDLPKEVDDNLRNMKIKHLLTMNSGHETDTMGPMRDNKSQTWVASFLAHPLIFEPGTHFLYNTGATYMLGAIIHAKTGKTLSEYLKPRFFDKLEIDGSDWEVSPEGLNTAGYGLRVKTNDIAKLGQFYLQNGTWKGEELLSAEWVAEASMKHTESQEGDGDWSQGYGYQFWRCKPDPGFYRGDGAFGQYCIIIPQYDMTIAVTSESWNMGKSMQVIWDTILPAVQTNALPENEKLNQELKDLCSHLSIETPAWHSTSPISAEINKKTFKTEENNYGINSVTFDIAEDQGEIIFETNDGENKLLFGIEKWVTNDTYAINNFPIEGRIHVPSLIVATATWVDDNTLQINRKFVEAIHGDSMVCVFEGDKLLIEFNNSVSENTDRGEDQRKPLIGMV